MDIDIETNATSLCLGCSKIGFNFDLKRRACGVDLASKHPCRDGGIGRRNGLKIR